MASPFDSKYNALREKIIYYANKHGIDANIFIWQIWYESSFRATVCSSANACGIAQFIPATAQRFGVNRNDIDSSLDGAARYMKWLLAQSYINGNYSFALAGYNAGEGRVKQYKGIPPFKETQDYVKKILTSAGKLNTKVVSNNQLPIVNNPVSYPVNNPLPVITNQEKDYGAYYILGALGIVLLLKL